MSTSKLPKVFGAGDVTICANLDGLRVYVGHTEIEYIRRIEMKLEDGKMFLEVSFLMSHDPSVSKSIEEVVRTAKTIPWVKIVP